VDLEDVKTLIIDDNATNRLILREMLSRWGAVVTEAAAARRHRGARARREANRPYALVLLDRRMPEVDGFEVAQRSARSRDGRRPWCSCSPRTIAPATSRADASSASRRIS
jgi:CheY-like chemotaxis protein